MEKFAIPGVGAIIEKFIGETKYILIQERQKEDESTDNGMLEIPAGKIREYENIFLCEAEGELKTETNETQNIRWEKAEDIKELLIQNPEQFFLMHVNALKKYFQLVKY